MSEIWRFSSEAAAAQDYEEAAAYLNDAMAISVLANLTGTYPPACSCPPFVYCHHKMALDARARTIAAGGGERHEIRERDGVQAHLVSGRPLATGHIADPGITCGCDDCTRARLDQREQARIMAADLAEIEAEESKYTHPDGCDCEPCVALWWRRTTALMRRPDPQLLRAERGTCADCGWKLPPDSSSYCFYCTLRRDKRTACDHGKREQCPACYPPRSLRQREGRTLSRYQRTSLALMAAGLMLAVAGFVLGSLPVAGIGAGLVAYVAIWRR